ncbi:NAD-dependent epimerase/dehydratase family protein [Hymenobacter sp. AT01-02]|uniref:NAD-dependent epimerase/dehydratase family protein n=1 Tax=Hymenobacter sp. AT01-02 TaxID=1571877 RepID=UPI0005F171D3|nr:NAD(P)-dependent oxidoreductase [Hymenobacter sp. AT01-02]
MKIAVIGSNSFLASYIIDEFSKNEENSLLLFGSGKQNSAEANKLFIEFRYPETLIDLSILLACDLVIYCAATGVQANGAVNTSLIYGVNAFYAIEIINYLNDHNFAGKWVSFGSYFEIGNTELAYDFNEEEIVASALEVPNHYCSSKRLLTKFIANKVVGISVFHFILPTIYGRRENLNRLIPYIINSLKEDKPLRLSAGKQMRQYLHCDDVAAVVKLVSANDYPTGIYNLANEGPIQIADLVKHIFSLFNRDAEPSLGTATTRDESMKYLAISPLKIAAHIPEWKPSIGIQEGIKEYMV